MRKQAFLLVLMALLSLVLVSARSYHMTLLTVGEARNETFGGTADAYLQVKYGTGRIFLDSFPLTKIDTQISTRYANEIACDYLDMDCSHYDFFYTIRADSAIVGGPSASGSLTILTIAALKNLKLRNDTVMTGTINSGGSIGPVGGIVKKAMAAEKAGFRRVLIPILSFNIGEINNTVLNLSLTYNTTTSETIVNISKVNATSKELTLEEANLSIEVIKVSNIEEALTYFTDTPIKQVSGEIRIPSDYTEIMMNISKSLCSRALDLSKKIRLTDEGDINKSDMFMSNINKTLESQEYYSAASYCFSFGVLLRKAYLKELNKTNPDQIEDIYKVTKNAVADFDKNLESINLTTLQGLETYIIVKERLLEAEESLFSGVENISTDDLAYAIERYYSGVYWSNFFNMKGAKIQLDKEYLKQACYKKLSEADERINYAGLYIPVELQSAEETINQAYAFAAKENYKMCLFKASFAKAESNLLLSSLSIDSGLVDELADEKLKAVRKLIIKEEGRGFFPIMGYSYYEYANSLNHNTDSFSSLIFSEYALELGNIEIYFPKKGFDVSWVWFATSSHFYLLIFFVSVLTMGIIIGIVLGAIIRNKKQKKEEAKEKRKKRK
jgi:uncharacterized protein